MSNSENNPICVIEDNVPIRKLFCTLLRKSGFHIIDFGDGTSAIEWLKNNLPYAAIIDILLPDHNGTEILKFIRSQPNGNKVPVIAATGFAHSSDRDKFIEMGFDSYISKPINTSTFVSEVSEVINQKNEIS